MWFHDDEDVDIPFQCLIVPNLTVIVFNELP